MAAARNRQGEAQLEAAIVDLATHGGDDLRGNQEHSAPSKERGNDRRLQQAGFSDRHLGQKAAERHRAEDGGRGEPDEPAAPRFEQCEAGKNGGAHPFVCRLVADAMQHATLANATWAFSQRYWRLVTVAMLLLLHVAAFRGVTDPWARALLLAHLGLLLLWQPFLRAEQRVSPMQAGILAVVAVTVMLRLDWWLLAFWVVVIAGLVGGKVYQHDAKWQRRCYLVMLGYLLALLAVVILPEIAPRREINADTRRAAEYLLPVFFVVIALFPAERESGEAPEVIDFFYSVFLMLLLVVVILGSFTFMTVTRSGYLESLTYTVFFTAAAVLLVGLAWNPRSGGGVGIFFARYLFSIGLPVERWLEVLAELLQREARPSNAHKRSRKVAGFTSRPL